MMTGNFSFSCSARKESFLMEFYDRARSFF
jgi:hypothetical protein